MTLVSARVQDGTLDDAAVLAAIQVSQREKNPDKFGVRYNFMRGLQVAVHLPATWIAFQSALAGSVYRKLELADVTPDMRRPVLRVVVTPASPNVKAVVVRSDNDNKEAIFPSASVPCQFTRLGRSCIIHEFDMAEVERIRRADKDRKGEFLIGVVALGEIQYSLGRYTTQEFKDDLKVKEGDLRDLGLR
jgi:hypothetical protein